MLTVGFTGHRSDRIAPDMQPVLRSRLTDAMLVLQDRRPPHECRLICGLADGTDQVAADAALALGWSLAALLPFEPADYARHMPDAATRTALAALLSRAAEVAVANGEPNGAPRDEHYAALGQTLIARSDVLLAVWDGDNSRRLIGGTHFVIDMALARGLPVLWVPLDAAQQISWLSPASQS